MNTMNPHHFPSRAELRHAELASDMEKHMAVRFEATQRATLKHTLSALAEELPRVRRVADECLKAGQTERTAAVMAVWTHLNTAHLGLAAMLAEEPLK